MIPIRSLFEAHLTVRDLQRSMAFYGDKLGLKLARVFPERKVAFYWTGEAGGSMLGVWEVGTAPQHMSLHIAFTVDLKDLLSATEQLRAANIAPLGFFGDPTDEPVVLAWMPAASLYFQDPDGNLLEYLCMLPDPPEPELGVIGWSEWSRRSMASRTDTPET
jgi:lactoylglutathione lyase